MEISGARMATFAEESAYAESMYREIPKRTTDYLQIVKNLGGAFSIEQIQVVKHYLFSAKHYLRGSTISSKFDPDYEVVQSWVRLSSKNPRNIRSLDVLMIQHEICEIQILLSNPNMSQKTAHELANQKYNYSKAVYDYRYSIGKTW